MSPTRTHRMTIANAIGAPSVDGTVHGVGSGSRQPSTAGMDTLADLASMQHHQQTARTNAGGLRSAEIYDSPAPSSTSAASTLPTVSRPQIPNQLRDSAQLRGASMDIAMTDGANEAPTPRTYSTDALSAEDLETVTQLAAYLTTNPFAYDSHVQLINILHRGLLALAHEPHSYNLLQDLHSARETMHAKFALGEDLWADWIQDQITLARSLENDIAIMELCQKAVEEDSNSTKLWEIYGRFMLGLCQNANPHDESLATIATSSSSRSWSDEDKVVAKEIFTLQQTMAVWERGSNETMWRLNDSHVLWNTYTDLLLQQLTSSPSHILFEQVRSHFINRLQTPHATWDQTLSRYSTFISTDDNSNYESAMVSATRLSAEAKTKSEARDMIELGLVRASQTHDKELELRAIIDYLDWEQARSRKQNIFDFHLTCALFQRATLQFPARTDIWEGYAMFLIEEMRAGHTDASPFPVLEKATRHCPWSGTLWSEYLLAAETKNLSFTEVEDIKHRGTSSGLSDAGGMEEVLKIQSAWCGFLRRRAVSQDSTDEDMDVAEVGIRSAIENMETLGRERYGKEYQGDPEWRLEKIYIKYLSQGRNYENAREEYERLISRKGDSYDFWLRYYLWEMGTWGKQAFAQTGINYKHLKPTRATEVLARVVNRPRLDRLDWPEKVIETYQYHCEDNEGPEELQLCTAQIWKAKKNLQKRRQDEAIKAYQSSQAQLLEQQQVAQSEVLGEQAGVDKVGKRKREDNVETGMSKKVRPELPESTEPQVEEQQPTTSSLLKRDRENATVVVKNLPMETTNTKLRQYFRDVSDNLPCLLQMR